MVFVTEETAFFQTLTSKSWRLSWISLVLQFMLTNNQLIKFERYNSIRM